MTARSKLTQDPPYLKILNKPSEKPKWRKCSKNTKKATSSPRVTKGLDGRNKLSLFIRLMSGDSKWKKQELIF
jgi:hypothetical protein